MTGWAAVVLIFGELAVVAFVALMVITVVMIRRQHPRRVWEKAAILTDLTADNPIIDTAISVDTLPHNILVERVITAEQHEQELIIQAQTVQADAITIIADALTIADAEHETAVRAVAAKRRHWATIRRLKGTT